MKKNFVKKLALGLALVMAVTSIPATSEAAAKPAFKSTSLTVEEGQTSVAVVKNTKGYEFKKVTTSSDAVKASLKKEKANKVKLNVTGVEEGKATVKAVFTKDGSKVKAKLAVTVLSADPVVTAATAATARTVVLTGKNLDKLTAADVAVEGYTVVAYNATKTSATVTVDRMLAPNTEINVTVGEFKAVVKYGLAVTGLAVTSATFDDDLVGQTVAFTINGEAFTAQDLIDNGYALGFAARNPLTGADLTTTLFADSVKGIIAVPAPHATYEVKFTVSNGTTVVTSDYAKVTVTDLHASVNSIDAWTLLNNGIGGVQTSTKLIVGETGTFEAITATVDGIGKQVVSPTAVTTSNPTVISVDAANNFEIKAETPGTATLTLYYGNVKKEVSFTVNVGVRYVASAKAVQTPNYLSKAYTSTKVVSSSAAAKVETLYIVPLDQFGDVVTAGSVYVGQNKAEVAAVTNAAAFVDVYTANNGIVTVDVEIPTNAKGYGTIVVRDRQTIDYAHTSSSRNLLNFGYTVVDNDTPVESKTKLVVVPATLTQSTDTNLELYGDDSTWVMLAQYNSNNDFIGYVDLDPADYAITLTDTAVVSTGSAAHPVYTYAKGILVTGTFKGTTTLNVRENGTTNDRPLQFVVTETAPAITGVKFSNVSVVATQNTPITYGSFLTLTRTSGDYIVTGITTNVSSTSKIRVATEGSVSAGAIYLDRNDDGICQSTVLGKPADIVLGYIELDQVTGSAFVLGPVDPEEGIVTSLTDNGYVKATIYGARNGVKVVSDVKAATTIKVQVPNGK